MGRERERRSRAKLRDTGEGQKGRRRAEPLGGGSDGRRVFQLLVKTRSRGGFYGIIKMFVDVDGEGGCGVAERERERKRGGWRRRGMK